MSLLQAIFLLAVLIIYLGVIPGMGFQPADFGSPSKMAKFQVDHENLYTLTFFTDWIFSLTIFILSLAYRQRFRKREPWLAMMMAGWGIISAGLFLAAGTLGIYGVHMAGVQYAADNASGLVLSMSLGQVQFAIETTAIAAIGIVVFCASLASARSKVFASWVNWCGYLTGFFYVVGMIIGFVSIPLGYMSIIGVLTGIFFNIGVAVSFMRQEHPELTLAPAN
jgi:hypothetical protein